MEEDHQQSPLPAINVSEPAEIENSTQSAESRSYKFWVLVALFAFLAMAGSSAAMVLGRLYFNNGGKSKWMASLVQVVGFPVLLPIQFFTTANITDLTTTNRSFPAVLASFYVVIGILAAGDCMLFAVGLQYIPVTTFSLISASQLGFIALFSYFLNRNRFTAYTLNSIVLVTISSILLVTNSSSGDSNKTSAKKYAVGSVCTLVACAGAAMLLSLTQLAFQKVIKKVSVRAVIDMAIYQCLVASVVLVVGLMASGDWKKVRREMEEFKTGQVSYVMNLVWSSVCWQVTGVGIIGLVFEVSSLFSNLIMCLGTPVGPVMAVIFLHDKLSGVKIMALGLAMWGSASYIYQHYLDDLKMKEKVLLPDGEVSEVAPVNQTA